MESLLVLLGLGLLAVPLVAFIMSLLNRSKANRLDSDVRYLREHMESFEQQVVELRRELREMQGADRAPASGVPGDVAKVVQAPLLPPKPATTTSAPVAAPPVVSKPTPPPVPPIPETTIPPAPPVAATAVQPPVAATTATPPPAAPRPPAIAPPPPRPPSAPPPPPPAAPGGRLKEFDWEALVGVKLFSWIAGICLALGAVYFLRYSIEHGYLSPPIRLAIGIVCGAGLLVACELKAARQYAVTANALDAAGVLILFSTFFAAHALWHLIPMLLTFGLMVLVTAVAVLLSIRRESVFIALLGLVGGFSTPALLSTGEDRPFGLFGYLLLLNAGLAWVGFKKRWPLLGILSLIFTTLYQWAWVMKFLTASKLPIAGGIFLVFPLLSAVALTIGTRRRPQEVASSLFEKTSAMSAVLPLFFALYMASVPAYGERYGLLFGFLMLLVAGLAAVAISRKLEEIHLAAGISTLLIWVIWLNISYTREAWPSLLAFLAGFVLIFLGAEECARALRRPFGRVGERATLAAPILLVAFPVLAAVEPASASPGTFFGSLLALLAILSGYALLRERGAVHYLAAFFALAGEAVWSAKYLDQKRLFASLIVYALFGLFYLGVPIAARRWQRKLAPGGTTVVVLFCSIALLLFLAASPMAAHAVWGLALLLAILNAGVFAEGAFQKMRWLSLAAIVLSWCVIGVWWAHVEVAIVLPAALFVVGGFALLVLGGNVWTGRKHGAEVAPGGIYLALVGHLFLCFVASQKPLSIPPWPIFGVLFLLDLAIGVAALSYGAGGIHIGAMLASQVLLMIWVQACAGEPWSMIAIVAAAAVALLGFAWFRLAPRIPRAGGVTPFAVAAAGSIFLAEVVAIMAASLSPSIGIGLLIPLHVISIAALLAIAAIMEWQALPIFAIPLAAMATFLWGASHDRPGDWFRQLIFGAAVHLAIWAYPLVLGRRVGKRGEPYWAAALSSIPFFFVARHALLIGGYGDVIGLLPVTQAALMAVLLRQLIDLEPAQERHQGRLALVAGSVLAYITLAIPLQLDKEWITIGWALQAAAIAWLYRKIPHRGLFWWSIALFGTVFVRLTFNRSVFEYHPRAEVPIWNWYLYTYLVCVVAFYFAARLMAKCDDTFTRRIPPASHLLSAAATILLFFLLNIEIADYYSTGSTLTFNLSAGLSQDLTYTIGWALFGVGLLAAGIVLSSRATRVASILLLLATIFKCFLHDLIRLGGLYRVASLVGLAISLALVAVVFQKFVLTRREVQ